MTTKTVGVVFALGLVLVLMMTAIAVARPATNADDAAGMVKVTESAPYTPVNARVERWNAIDEALTPPYRPQETGWDVHGL